MSDTDTGACPSNEWCDGTRHVESSLRGRCSDCWVRYADRVVQERQGVSPMSDIEATFHRLLIIWKGETGFLPFHKVFEHPSHQAIVALGLDAVPVILREMERKPTWLGHAIFLIVGEHPQFTEDMAGRLDLQTEAWLAWGRDRGYI